MTSTQPTSQSFNRLLKARLPENILNAVTACCWEALGNQGEPLAIPAAEDLKVFFQAEHAKGVLGALNTHALSISNDSNEHIRNRAQEIVDEIPKDSLPDTWTDVQIVAAFYHMGEVRLRPEKINEHLSDETLENQYSAYVEAVLVLTETLFRFKEDTEQAIENLHHAWQIAREFDKTLKHPLAPAVRAWLLEQIPPRPREYDRTHPGATLPQKSVSIARITGHETIAEAPASVEVPSAGQLFLPTFERKMYLPEYLPIQIVQGFNMTGRRGVLPYEMRFFFEVSMSLKPKQRKGWYTKTLFDAAVDIRAFDPNSDEAHKKYLRAEHKDNIRNALIGLGAIRLPYRAEVGGIGLWKPFYDQSIPTRLSEKDFPIRMRVELSPDDTRSVLVVREIVRDLYVYLTQLNAYLAGSVLFNQYGISPRGNLIDPTEPDPNTPRLESGQLVNPSTNQPMFSARGKPITDLYAPEAFEALSPYRVYRKEADNYPVLEEEEIMRGAYPNEPWKHDGKKKRWADKAWDAWKAIADKGYIRIKERSGGLWILPSDYHVRLHHEILESSKKSQGD